MANKNLIKINKYTFKLKTLYLLIQLNVIVKKKNKIIEENKLI